MLTPKQEKFCQCIALENMTKTDAYKTAYDASNSTDKTANEKGCRLASQGKIQARIQELRGQVMSSKIMTAQERLEWLTQVIQSNSESTKNRLTAAEIMNKMQGEYVQKVVADVDTHVNINIELTDE